METTSGMKTGEPGTLPVNTDILQCAENKL